MSTMSTPQNFLKNCALVCLCSLLFNFLSIFSILQNPNFIDYKLDLILETINIVFALVMTRIYYLLSKQNSFKLLYKRKIFQALLIISFFGNLIIFCVAYAAYRRIVKLAKFEQSVRYLYFPNNVSNQGVSEQAEQDVHNFNLKMAKLDLLQAQNFITEQERQEETKKIIDSYLNLKD